MMELKAGSLIAMVLMCGLMLAPCHAGADEAAAQVLVNLEECYNNDGISWDEDPLDGDLDFSRLTLPAEQLPESNTVISRNGLQFLFPAKEDGKYNNVACFSQTIPLPSGQYSGLHMLAAATNGVYQDNFIVRYDDGGEEAKKLKIPRLQGTPGFAGKIALKVDHKHDARGDTAMAGNLYALTVALDPARKAVALSLPDRPDIHIFALTLER